LSTTRSMSLVLICFKASALQHQVKNIGDLLKRHTQQGPTDSTRMLHDAARHHNPGGCVAGDRFCSGCLRA
jgi:hypothetical protein